MNIIIIGFITVGILMLFIVIPTLFYFFCDCKDNNKYTEV